jgi:hypothetical protein
LDKFVERNDAMSDLANVDHLGERAAIRRMNRTGQEHVAQSWLIPALRYHPSIVRAVQK